MFVHFDIRHIGGNMLMLLVVGELLEERLGSLRVLAAYLASGYRREYSDHRMVLPAAGNDRISRSLRCCIWTGGGAVLSGISGSRICPGVQQKPDAPDDLPDAVQRNCQCRNQYSGSCWRFSDGSGVWTLISPRVGNAGSGL